MNSLHALHVIASMDPVSGGPCQVLRSTIPFLNEHGIGSEVVTFDVADGLTYAYDPFPVHGVGPAKNPWGYRPHFSPWMKQNIARFDVVILHGLWLYNGFATLRAVNYQRRMTGKDFPKFLIMSHGMLDPWFQRDPSRRLKAWRNWFYWKLVERNVVNSADGILFTCEQELVLARETFVGYAPKRELSVRLGVSEPPSETPAMRVAFLKVCPIIANRTYLLFISRIHPKKGVDLLIRAYARLLQSVGGNSRSVPDLVIAGPTDSAYAQEMMTLADRLNLVGATARVHFVGMLQGDAKWGAFHGCDAFVLPSHQENFGIAVAEALACGKPVLISDQVNIWREIESSGAGFVSDDNDEGTYQLLDQWCQLSETEKQSMQTKARVCYKDHFDVAVSTRRMADALGSVVDNAS